MIFAKRADKPEPVLLAKSAEEVDDPSLGAGMGGISPVIHGDRAYWHTAMVPEIGGVRTTQIMSTDLASGQETRLVQQGAAYPVSLDGGLAAIRLESLNKLNEDDGPNYLSFENATGIVLLNDDGTTTDLLRIADSAPEDARFGELKGSGNSISFSFNGETFIVDTKTKEAVSFAEPTGGYLAGLAHCGDLVTWTYADSNGEGIGKQYVYSTGAKTLRVVTEPELFGISQCQGEYVSWSVRDSTNDASFATEVVTQWKS